VQADGQTDSAPLLDREGELAEIAGVVEAAREAGSVLLIEGPAGIGKSALLAAATDLAAPAATVATARGADLERGFAFGVMLALLGSPVEAARADGRADDLFAGAASLARPLFERGGADSGGDPFPMLHGLHWLCANLAERHPLVLCVDDLQWADRESLRFIAYLSARLAELPLLIAGAVRTGEPGVDADLHAEIACDPGARTIAPRPLGQEAVATLAARALGGAGAAREAERIHVASGGNPLFVGELLRAARDGGPVAAPQAIVALVERRVAAQDEAVRAGARALALLGDSARPDEIGALTGLGTDAALTALDELAAAELTARDAPTRFVHPVVREAVLAGLPAGERIRMHHRAAEILRNDDPARAAAHLTGGDPPTASQASWAAPLLRGAAADARARGGSATAVRYLRHALDEPCDDAQRRAILLELGTIEAQARDGLALDHLERAAALADDPVEHARIALALGNALFYFVALEQCADVCREAIERLAGADRELWLALEATALNAEALLGVNRERPGLLAAEVAAASTPGERAALVHVVADLASRGEVEAATVRALGQRALGDGRLLDQVGAASPVYIYAGTALAWLDDYAAAIDLTTRGLEQGRATGSRMTVAYALALRAGAELRAGDLPAAEADAEMVVDELAEADPMAYAVALAWWLEALVERGDIAGARAALDRSGLTGPLPELGTIFYLMLARAALAHAEGDVAGAAAEYEEVGRRTARASCVAPGVCDWRSRAGLALLDLGDVERARALTAEELALARRAASPRGLAVALRAHALTASTPVERLALLDEAAAVAAPAGARLEHARVLVDRGVAAHACGRDDARGLIEEGMDLAHRCGAAALVERALDALRQTGARPRRPRVRGAAALTPQERRIATLAAGGASNREIAEALFLTRRTVETHLSNAYRKLGIGSRAELARELGDDS
jgi:DNA-binding CsgD family transcriptional regulator